MAQALGGIDQGAAAPRVTVLLPVHNGEAHVGDAIDSILGQSFADFDLLIVDDGSTDRTPEIIRSRQDPRIQVVRNESNLGLIASLNLGISLARGEYLARMDSDDLSEPERLRTQVLHMDRNPEVGVCGSAYRRFGEDSGTVIHPENHDEIVAAMLEIGCVVAHPTVMIRRSILIETGLRYDADYPHAEDYRLWSELLRHTRFHNLRQPLVRYRIHAEQVSQRRSSVQAYQAARIRSAMLTRLLPDASSTDSRLLTELLLRRHRGDTRFIRQAGTLLDRLQTVHAERPFFPNRRFRRLVTNVWYSACRHAYSNEPGVIRLYVDRRFRQPWRLRFWRNLGLVVLKTSYAWARTGRRKRVFEVRGTLGDQIFQYSRALDLMKAKGRVHLDLSQFSHYRLRSFRLNETWARFRVGGGLESALLTRRPRISESLPDTPHPTGADYRLECPKLAMPRASGTSERLRRELRSRAPLPASHKAMARHLERPNSVAVHLKASEWCETRDPLSPADPRWPFTQPDDYYRRAWNRLLEELPDARAYLFTDLPEHELDRLGIPSDKAPLFLPELADDIQSLELLSRARHHILSSYALGWWSAWKAERPGSRIIAPMAWNELRNAGPAPEMPESWIRI